MTSLQLRPFQSTARRMPAMANRLAVPGMDRVLMGATAVVLLIGTFLVWAATANNEALTGGDSTAYVRKHVVNIVMPGERSLGRVQAQETVGCLHH